MAKAFDVKKTHAKALLHTESYISERAKKERMLYLEKKGEISYDRINKGLGNL